MPRFLAVLAGALIATGVSAGAASAKTLKLYTHTIASALYHANGTPITNRNERPVVGDVFASVDRVYLGTRQHHTLAVGYDHIVCALRTLPSQGNTGGSGLCDATLYVSGGLVYINRTKVPFTNKFTLKVNGAGKFKRAKTLTQTATGNNWSEIVIDY